MASRSDSKTDSNYFNMTGPKSIKNGKYKMETVHTVDIKCMDLKN